MSTEQHLHCRIRVDNAALIEHKVVDLAVKQGLHLTGLSWNLDQGMDHSGPHRLDIYANDMSVRMYFTDNELLETSALDNRISCVLASFDGKMASLQSWPLVMDF